MGTVVPLSTPFSLQIYPTYYCNFKCNYCFRNAPKNILKRKIYYNKVMDFNIFKKAVDDAKQFAQKLKTVTFTGGGDPLVYPHIVEMVDYAEKSQIAERTEILTNAALLTPDVSDRLISAGLKKLRISIEGVDAARYKEVCGVSIDFDNFLNNLRYFFEHKKETYVYIKIIDCALRCPEEKDKFYELFSPIADEVAIEHLVPLDHTIKYDEIGEISGLNQQDGKGFGTNICSFPYFMLLLYPDGSVSPCCGLAAPVIGKITEDSLADIWNGSAHRQMLHAQLKGYQTIDVCKNCQAPCYQINPSDYLDKYVERIQSRFAELQF